MLPKERNFLLNVDGETKDGVGLTSVFAASRNEHINAVKYLYVTCNTDIVVKQN